MPNTTDPTRNEHFDGVHLLRVVGLHRLHRRPHVR
jgi:hypothetical protein